MTESTITLAAALAAVRADMGTIAKKHNNEFGGFKYAKLPDLLEKCQPILEKNGLSLHFNGGMPVEIGDRPWQPVSAVFEGHGEKHVVEQYFAWGGGDDKAKPKAKMDATQTTGSLITYGCKYVLMMALALRLEVDDPDATSGKVTAKKPAGEASQPDVLPSCKDCGKGMRKHVSKKGKEYYACPDRKFGDESTHAHSAVFADKIRFIGTGGDWEEK